MASCLPLPQGALRSGCRENTTRHGRPSATRLRLIACGIFSGALRCFCRFLGSTLGFFLSTAHLFLGGAAGLLLGLALCHLLLLAHLFLGGAAGLLLGLLTGHFLRTALGCFLSATHLGLSLTAGLLLRLTQGYFLGAAGCFLLLTLHCGCFGLLTSAFSLSGGLG